MRKPLVIGNWKLNPSRAGAVTLVKGILDGLTTTRDAMAEVGVAPTFLHIAEVAGLLADTDVRLGAQTASLYASGAYTGEVSASMLGEYGCDFAIVGHSERRTLFHESDALVAEKARAVLEAGLTPVICVGETLDERDAGDTKAVVIRQLQAVFEELAPTDLGRCVLAYEPVWAIGTGKTASPDEAQEVHTVLRTCLADHGVAAEQIRVLYGGSVKPNNAKELFAMADIDGGLIGGASLVAEDFCAIVAAAH